MDKRKQPAFWIFALYGAMAALCLAMTIHGFSRPATPMWFHAGFVGLVISLGLIPIALYARRVSRGASGRGDAEAFGELTRAIRELNEVGALSDDARRVLNRNRERGLLRKAIEEDIQQREWDAAMVLVKELAERFGYRADAEVFRRRIETERFESLNTEIDQAVANVDRLVTQARWDEAGQEAARVTRLYPDSDKVQGLRHRVQAARDRYKHDLERRFLIAAENERVDDAMELLQELDSYLTEREAEPLQEVARGVIGKARENLGVQFKIAVQDKRWTDAAIVGERVIKDFPNTRMAAEIREMIDEVRQRASAMLR